MSEKGLLNTRYLNFFDNTFDYWEVEESYSLNEEMIKESLLQTPKSGESNVSIYIHVPFCANNCLFCAFAGANSSKLRQIKDYTGLLIKELKMLSSLLNVKNSNIASINIGGGSPNLLGENMEYVLSEVCSWPGVSEQTEISVESSLNGVDEKFIDILKKYNVTKISFGIQTVDDKIRADMKLLSLKNKILDNVLDKIGNKIKIKNIDLLVGLPGQSMQKSVKDLEYAMTDKRISAISIYLLSKSSAVRLPLSLGTQATEHELSKTLILMHDKLMSEGWVRKGSSTYYRGNIDAESLAKIKGNEAIGIRRYEDILISVGPSAIGYAPGIRYENTDDLDTWTEMVKNDKLPFNYANSSLITKKDLTLTLFPLRFEGLLKKDLEKIKESEAITSKQFETFHKLISEGFIRENGNKYELSILGKVFMGNIVHDLKKEADQRIIEKKIEYKNLLKSGGNGAGKSQYKHISKNE